MINNNLTIAEVNKILRRYFSTKISLIDLAAEENVSESFLYSAAVSAVYNHAQKNSKAPEKYKKNVVKLCRDSNKKQIDFSKDINVGKSTVSYWCNKYPETKSRKELTTFDLPLEKENELKSFDSIIKKIQEIIDYRTIEINQMRASLNETLSKSDNKMFELIKDLGVQEKKPNIKGYAT